jgi:hypothetical protein
MPALDKSDGMRLLEELHLAIQLAEAQAGARAAEAAAQARPPIALGRDGKSPIEILQSSSESFDQVCQMADRLAAKAEAELAETEAALKQWLNAAATWNQRLDKLVEGSDALRPAA